MDCARGEFTPGVFVRVHQPWLGRYLLQSSLPVVVSSSTSACMQEKGRGQKLTQEKENRACQSPRSTYLPTNPLHPPPTLAPATVMRKCTLGLHVHYMDVDDRACRSLHATFLVNVRRRKTVVVLLQFYLYLSVSNRATCSPNLKHI